MDDDLTAATSPDLRPPVSGPCRECGRPLPVGTVRYCVRCGAEVAPEAAPESNDAGPALLKRADERPGATWSTGSFRAPSPLDGVTELPPVFPPPLPESPGSPERPETPPEPVATPVADPAPVTPPGPADAWYSDAWAVEAPVVSRPATSPFAAQPPEAPSWGAVAHPPPAPAFARPLADTPLSAPAFTAPGPPPAPHGGGLALGFPEPGAAGVAPRPAERSGWPVLPLVAAGLVLVVTAAFGVLWLTSRGGDDVTAAQLPQASAGAGSPAALASAPADVDPPTGADGGAIVAAASAGDTAAASVSSSVSSSASSSVPASAEELVADLDRLLDASTEARGDVAATAVGLQACRVSPARAATVFRTAAGERDRLAAEATALSVGADGTLAGAGNLIRTFVALQRASAQADQAFADWADAVAAAGCAGQARHTSDWDLANRYSATASAAKSRFVALWNPVAAAHGGHARSADAI